MKDMHGLSSMKYGNGGSEVRCVGVMKCQCVKLRKPSPPGSSGFHGRNGTRIVLKEHHKAVEYL